MGKYGWGQLIALPLCWVLYLVGSNVWREWRKARANHSPIDGAAVLSWIKLQANRDTDPDTDTEPEPPRGRGKRVVQVAENRWHIEYYDRSKDDLPPATPSPGRADSQLHTWIRRSFEEGATYGDVVREGQTLFGKSEATIKRAIRNFRKAQNAARSGR